MAAWFGDGNQIEAIVYQIKLKQIKVVVAQINVDGDIKIVIIQISFDMLGLVFKVNPTVGSEDRNWLWRLVQIDISKQLFCRRGGG